MSISERDLIAQIEMIAPRNLEEHWDNSGRQISIGKRQIERIIIALEITRAVIDEAISCGADYIVTHHPLIFRPMDVIDNNNITGNYIVQLIRAGISVYSAHTTFDSAFGGNNDYLAELLGLQRIRRFQPPKLEPEKEIVGRIGDLEPQMLFRDVCALVKQRLNINRELFVVGDPEKKIRKIGICTGAGGSVLDAAIDNGCSLYITGDVSYHQAQMAKESGLCIIDAGHYESERIFVENFAEKLRKATDSKVEIIEAGCEESPFTVFV